MLTRIYGVIRMEEFLAIIFGSLISALIAILSNYLTGKMHEQNWRKENIYRPLYNEVSEIVEGLNIKKARSFMKTWKGIDSYSRLRIDEELRRQLEYYVSKIGEYEDTFQRVTALVSENVEEAIRRAFPPQMISKDGKSIILGKGAFIEIMKWFELFKDVITLHLTEDNGMKLCEALIEYSEKRRMGYERHFRVWKLEHPELFDRLLEELHKAHEDIKPHLKELEGLSNEMVKLSKKLVRALETRINKIW